jgi:hypothetical protein
VRWYDAHRHELGHELADGADEEERLSMLSF